MTDMTNAKRQAREASPASGDTLMNEFNERLAEIANANVNRTPARDVAPRAITPVERLGEELGSELTSEARKLLDEAQKMLAEDEQLVEEIRKQIKERVEVHNVFMAKLTTLRAKHQEAKSEFNHPSVE